MPLVQRYSTWFALLIGAALSLAFAPFNYWPLAIACPAWLFYMWRGAGRREAAKLGFWFTAGTYVAGTYWLYHSIYVIGQAPLWVAIILMLGLVAIMGGYTALFAYVQARWFPIDSRMRLIVALPAGWVLLEWLRGWLFSGFPWLALGYSQIDTPLAGFAPLIGVYGLSWLTALVAGCIVWLFTSGTWRPSKWPVMVIALAPWMGGWLLFGHLWTEATDKPITVAIVQGAVPQEMKWTQAQHDATLALYRDLTLPHLGAQLIVWPESSLPDWAESLTGYLTALKTEAHAHGSEVLLGIQRFDASDDSAYNGAVVLTDPPQWYYKRHLVPFGEYFPVPEFVRNWMRMMSLPHADFASGKEEQPALNAAGEKIGMTICYEDAYGHSMLDVLSQATLLVNITNDAWFGDSTARHQHLQISRMRALEAGRPNLRAANDGISAIIDARGAIVRQLPSFKPGVLTATVQPRTGLTFYARVGNWLIISLCALLLAVAVALNKRRL